MPVYATLADLYNTLPQQAISSVSDEAKLAALADASTEADGYLQAQYRLPLTEWGSDLRRYVCKIAAYNIMTARGYNPEGKDDLFRAGHDDALKWLNSVSEGDVLPPTIADSSGHLVEGGASITSGVRGNTVGGFISTPYADGPRPYPYMTPAGGRRGW